MSVWGAGKWCSSGNTEKKRCNFSEMRNAMPFFNHKLSKTKHVNLSFNLHFIFNKSCLVWGFFVFWVCLFVCLQ